MRKPKSASSPKMRRAKSRQGATLWTPSTFRAAAGRFSAPATLLLPGAAAHGGVRRCGPVRCTGRYDTGHRQHRTCTVDEAFRGVLERWSGWRERWLRWCGPHRHSVMAGRTFAATHSHHIRLPGGGVAVIRAAPCIRGVARPIRGVCRRGGNAGVAAGARLGREARVHAASAPARTDDHLGRDARRGVRSGGNPCGIDQQPGKDRAGYCRNLAAPRSEKWRSPTPVAGHQQHAATEGEIPFCARTPSPRRHRSARMR